MAPNRIHVSKNHTKVGIYIKKCVLNWYTKVATKCLASQEKEVTTLSINRDLGIVSCLRNGVEYRTVGLCQLMNMYHTDGRKKS